MTESPQDFLTEAPKKADGAARRLRLREFQAQLLDRMQAARSGSAAASSQLGVMMGGKRWLLNLKEAGEIMAVAPITRVPLTQNWYLGLTNMRGSLVSVIDFAAYQGDALQTVDKDSRIIAFSSSLSFNCALLVSRVMGLRNVDEMQPQPVQADGSPWMTASYLDRDSCTWHELSLSAIIQDSRFLHVGI